MVSQTLFFQIAPIIEIKKASAYFKKTDQNLPVKRPKTFFALHLQLKNVLCKF